MRKKAEKGRVLSIFLTFLKFGCFTFGGGWSIVSQIQKEYVEDKHWITDEELLDFTSVGRSVPGLMISNASVLFGYHAAGFGGALAALAGEHEKNLALRAQLQSLQAQQTACEEDLRALQAAQLIPLIEYSFIIERKPPVSIIADCPMQGMMCKHGLTAALFYNIFRLGATGFDKKQR